jgi:hypothetical protein
LPQNKKQKFLASLAFSHILFTGIFRIWMLRLVRSVNLQRFGPTARQFSTEMGLREVQDVDIDPTGTFKYILIKVCLISGCLIDF